MRVARRGAWGVLRGGGKGRGVQPAGVRDRLEGVQGEGAQLAHFRFFETPRRPRLSWPWDSSQNGGTDFGINPKMAAGDTERRSR